MGAAGLQSSFLAWDLSSPGFCSRTEMAACMACWHTGSYCTWLADAQPRTAAGRGTLQTSVISEACTGGWKAVSLSPVWIWMVSCQWDRWLGDVFWGVGGNPRGWGMARCWLSHSGGDRQCQFCRLHSPECSSCTWVVIHIDSIPAQWIVSKPGPHYWLLGFPLYPPRFWHAWLPPMMDRVPLLPYLFFLF